MKSTVATVKEANLMIALGLFLLIGGPALIVLSLTLT